jgi:hypothetical protein
MQESKLDLFFLKISYMKIVRSFWFDWYCDVYAKLICISRKFFSDTFVLFHPFNKFGTNQNGLMNSFDVDKPRKKIAR